jgi:hypothetical protein
MEHKKRKTQQFNVGDSVVICKKLETIVSLQENHGGFVKDMAKV